jgi:hypothetical protein
MVACLLLVVAAGCENSESESPAPFDISGTWAGEYITPWRGMNITAEIEQNGSDIIIKTSLPAEGGLMVGIMDGEGNIMLKDSYGGQTWTSYGVQTANSIFIRDYLLQYPAYEDVEGAITNIVPLEQDIILSR